jgi:hypothetical protein
MRAAPVAGDSQVRVIRTCVTCAHAPDTAPPLGRGAEGEIDMHTASRPFAGVRGAGR